MQGEKGKYLYQKMFENKIKRQVLRKKEGKRKKATKKEAVRRTGQHGRHS